MGYNLYIKQAWQLMRQERFFSSIYIISTGLAISMVMVLSISFYLKLANLYPENNRDRTLSMKMAMVKNKNGGISSSAIYTDLCSGRPGYRSRGNYLSGESD